jgi:hypothetical protein
MSERTLCSSRSPRRAGRPRPPGMSRLWPIALIVGLATGPLTAAARDLSGTWVLDEARSDDPGEIVEKADYGGKIGSIFRRTRPSAVIFGIPLPVPKPSERDKPRSQDNSSLVKSGHVLSVIDTLKIHEDKDAIELLYDNLEAATYELGVALDTGYSTVTASESGDRLVVLHALSGGGEITETYALDRTGNELHWSVRVKNDGIRTIRVDRIYTRSTADTGATRLNLMAGN